MQAASPPSTNPQAASQAQIVRIAEMVANAHQQMRQQMARVIVGQEKAIDLIIIALLCRGHGILEGVPGLAKTLMISSISKLLGLDFGRIQFTPDLMPSDITGTEIVEEDKSTGKRLMRFVRGPIFANILLADEINRTPPKTQSALLQAMAEQEVTVAGVSYPIDKPFFVLGTQNPIESEGTYPMPEAQLDRFMFKITIAYPTLDEEIAVAMNTTSKDPESLTPIVSKDDIMAMQKVVRQVVVSHPVASYAVRLVRATRPAEDAAPDYVKKYLTWGAGPRACQAILLGAKAHALLDGRANVSLEDIQFIARPVLRHRIVTNFTAESENISTDHVIGQLLNDLPEH